jgi:hypothetical protein
MFFFEKKNQKTFVRGRVPRRQHAPRDKSFLLLFSKKKTFLCLQNVDFTRNPIVMGRA